MSGYQIADEPAPSTFARFAVNPLYPMLASMLAGDPSYSAPELMWSRG